MVCAGDTVARGQALTIRPLQFGGKVKRWQTDRHSGGFARLCKATDVPVVRLHDTPALLRVTA